MLIWEIAFIVCFQLSIGNKMIFSIKQKSPFFKERFPIYNHDLTIKFKN